MFIRTLKQGYILLIAAITLPAFADHSWNNYHWARTTAPFDLTIVNSTTSDWGGYVVQSIYDWSRSAVDGRSLSTVLNMVEEPGSTSRQVRRKCKGPSGQVRICNLAYGQTGWLGIAGISIDPNGHILTGYTKLNDTYFNWDFYNNPEWKQSVTCQELGHNIGLHHQDEDFDNVSLDTCMDYQDPPWEYPNQHDYDELESIYGHEDNSGDDSDGGGSGGGCNAPRGKGCNKSDVGNNGEIGNC